MPARQPDAHGLTFLEQRAVGENAASDYNTRYQEFLTWAAEAGLATDSPDELDQALTEWMNFAFFQGRASADGSKLVAAVKHVRRLPMRTKLFPRACRAVKGWKKLAPPGSRLPLPWEVVCLIAKWMVDNNMRHQAELVMMLFIFYLRPKELFSLLGCQLVRPVQGASKELAMWSIVLYPHESGKVPKRACRTSRSRWISLSTSSSGKRSSGSSAPRGRTKAWPR